MQVGEGGGNRSTTELEMSFTSTKLMLREGKLLLNGIN